MNGNGELPNDEFEDAELEAAYYDNDDDGPGVTDDSAPSNDEGMNFDEPPAQTHDDLVGIQKLAALKRDTNKANIEKLYSDYLKKLENSEGDLFTALTKFAQHKAYSRMRESADADINYKDVAQDAVLSIWEQLKVFSSKDHPRSKDHPEPEDRPKHNTPSDFYNWVHRICWAGGKHAAGKVKKEHDAKVPLQIESDDDPGFMKDNPEVYKQEDYHTPTMDIPQCIQGLDRTICIYVRHGLSYKQIGLEHGLTESAVKQRLAKIRKRLKELKAGKP